LGVIADLVEGNRPVHAVQADPEDDKYPAAALEGRADVVVSGDHHLLDPQEYGGIPILTPRAFISLLPRRPTG